MGGPTIESNLALSCQGCNNHKSNKTTAADPLTGLETTLFNPRDQVWSEHFVWSDDYTTVEGLTATGRATVIALKLNREGLVNMRWALYAILEHPPEEHKPNRDVARVTRAIARRGCNAPKERLMNCRPS